MSTTHGTGGAIPSSYEHALGIRLASLNNKGARSIHVSSASLHTLQHLGLLRHHQDQTVLHRTIRRSSFFTRTERVLHQLEQTVFIQPSRAEQATRPLMHPLRRSSREVSMRGTVEPFTNDASGGRLPSAPRGATFPIARSIICLIESCSSFTA